MGSPAGCCQLPPAEVSPRSWPLAPLLARHCEEAIPFTTAAESYFLVGEGQPELVSSKLSWLEEGPKKCQYKSTCRGRVETEDVSPLLTGGLLDWHSIISSYRNKQNCC